MAAAPDEAVRETPRWFEILSGISSRLNLAAAIAAAAVIFVMTVTILIEIVMRAMSTSTYLADTIGAYGVAACTFLGMAWTMERNGMIRVLALHQSVPRLVQWWFEFIAIAGTIAITLLFGQHVWRSLAKNFVRGTMSSNMIPFPLWVPDAVFFVGIALVILHMIVRLCRLFLSGVSQEREVVL